MTCNTYGKGRAIYQACRDTGSLKEKILSDLMEASGILSAVDTKKPLPHGVTAHSRTDGVHTYVFVENYANAQSPVIPLSGEMENMLTGEKVSSCTLPPYGFGIFKK